MIGGDHHAGETAARHGEASEPLGEAAGAGHGDEAVALVDAGAAVVGEGGSLGVGGVGVAERHAAQVG